MADVSSGIGERLKAERVRLALSQISVAQHTGVSKTTQILYESGERTPDAVYLRALAELGLDIYFIISGQRHEEALGKVLGRPLALEIFEHIEQWAAKRKPAPKSATKMELLGLFLRYFGRDNKLDRKLLADHLSVFERTAGGARD